MSTTRTLLITLILLIVSFTVGVSRSFGEEESRYDIFYQNQMISHVIINQFFEQIDHGELVIFEKTITRNMIEPMQIAYLYSFGNEALTISIYSKLVERLNIPNFKEFVVEGISIDVDEFGDIKNVRSHVIAK